MKKNILLIAVLFYSPAMFAQSRISYGFRAGITSAEMRGDAVNSLNELLDFADKYVSTGSRTGFFTGTYVSFPLGTVLTVEPALNYSQKGYQVKGSLNVKDVNILGINAKAQLQLNYIELPLLLKVNFGGFQLFAGPELSYLLNADVKASAGALGFNILSTRIPVTSRFNRWDGGITGGIGYQFNNGLHILASYDYSLYKVDAGEKFNAYNSMMKIGVGLDL